MFKRFRFLDKMLTNKYGSLFIYKINSAFNIPTQI